MRIRAVHQDGRQEVLTVVGPLEIIESNIENGMSHFQDATCTDYYFNVEDGTYDGWGRGAACGAHMSEDEAHTMIETIEAVREMVPAILPEEEA